MSFEVGTATSFTDLLTKLNTFLTKGHSLVPLFTGTGNGTITGLIGSTSAVQETVTITFTSSTAFNVVGSVSGSFAAGTVGNAYSNSKVSFTVNQGGTNWVAGDTISFVLTPPWLCKRLFGGAYHLSSIGLDITKVVDGSTTTYDNPVAASLPQWAGIKLLVAAEVFSVAITIYTTPSNGPRAYEIQYSDNGTDWTTVLALTNQTWTQSKERRVHNLTAPGVHLFWRVLITVANGTNVDLSDISLYSAINGQTLDLIPWFGDAIWEAPGNGDEDSIFVGVKLKFNPVGAYWMWKLAGLTGYAAGSQFENQPGYSGGRAYMTLWDSSIPYWFIASGKSVKVVTKISSQYEQCYMGFIDSYMTPGGFPYPLLVGGSMGFLLANADPIDSSSSYRYAVTDDTHRSWWSPGGSNYQSNNYYGHVSFRLVSGNWTAVMGQHYYDFTADTVLYWWPTSERDKMQDLRVNLDGSVPMFPLMLHGPDGSYGEPEGVMTLCGNNQSVENIIAIGRADWLVIQNIYRVGVLDYIAYRLS